MPDPGALILMFAVLPLWVAAGLADWWCHRRTSIESTSGMRESVFHLVLFAQMGIAGLAAMLLQVNLALLVLLAALFLVHELTTWLELRFVLPRREVGAAEQMVHSFMELLPLAALFLLASLAIGEPDWSLRLKDKPLPPAYLLAACAAIAVFNLAPLLEEAWRCWRAGAAAGGPARGAVA
jgi:hypothetical protein